MVTLAPQHSTPRGRYILVMIFPRRTFRYHQKTKHVDRVNKIAQYEDLESRQIHIQSTNIRNTPIMIFAKKKKNNIPHKPGNPQRYRLTLWEKLGQPILTLAMICWLLPPPPHRKVVCRTRNILPQLTNYQLIIVIFAIMYLVPTPPRLTYIQSS